MILIFLDTDVHVHMLPCTRCRSFQLPFLPEAPLISYSLGQYPGANCENQYSVIIGMVYTSKDSAFVKTKI